MGWNDNRGAISLLRRGTTRSHLDGRRRQAPRCRGSRKAVIGAVVGLLSSGLIVSLVVHALSPHSLFVARFPSRLTLQGNETGTYAPGSQWLVTSGSLFGVDGEGWTGPVDGRAPDLESMSATDSAVFRAVTREADFTNVSVSFDLLTVNMTDTKRTPPQDYDGVHVFLRYQSPQSLYAVDVLRRDHTLTIKRKTFGGDSNGGLYETLATASGIPITGWTHIQVQVWNASDGVHLGLALDKRPVLSAIDTGQTGPALSRAGRVGLRGDNTEFRFRNFTVNPYRA